MNETLHKWMETRSKDVSYLQRRDPQGRRSSLSDEEKDGTGTDKQLEEYEALAEWDLDYLRRLTVHDTVVIFINVLWQESDSLLPADHLRKSHCAMFATLAPRHRPLHSALCLRAASSGDSAGR